MKKSLTNKAGDVRTLGDDDLRHMRSAKEVLPSELVNILPKRKRGERGKQKAATKVPITLRYSPEVVKYFKTTGSGWQTRMDDALKEWISQHSRAA